MKKQTKKFTTGLIISAVTLAVGYAITMLSFNIFGELTINQMRAVFAADIIAFLLVGAFAYFRLESKRNEERKQREFEERHRRRIERSVRENEEIKRIIFQANKVA